MPEVFFLTIEGSEGVGKSTSIKFIQDYLQTAQRQFILTREPGGTQIAEEIRKILLNPSSQELITSDTELLLMFASRSQHIANVILPALQSGKSVISDRYVDASYAYQGGGRGFNLEQIKMLDNWIVDGVRPNKTILLDAPAEVGLARTQKRGAADRIEQEKKEFFDRVRAAYLVRAKEEPTRFCIIDATQPLEKVQQELRKVLDELLGKTSES